MVPKFQKIFVELYKEYFFFFGEKNKKILRARKTLWNFGTLELGA